MSATGIQNTKSVNTRSGETFLRFMSSAEKHAAAIIPHTMMIAYA